LIHSQLDALFPGNEPVLLDGAMGSALRDRGWPRDRPTVLANLQEPEQVRAVHAAHRAAGARVLGTNSFGALMAPASECLDAVRASVRLARETAGERVRVAGCVAAFGLGVGDPQLRRVVETLLDEGVDVLVFETCNGARDAEAALALHAELAPRLPCVVCASTTDGSRADRARVHAVVELVQRRGDERVEAGLNCCRGPHDALRLASELSPRLRWLKPSTGVGAERVGDDVMAAFVRAARGEGARFLGGCCGTSADALAAMGAALRHR